LTSLPNDYPAENSLMEIIADFATTHSAVATITLNRTQVANAISTAMWLAIPEIIGDLVSQGAKVIVFTGRGKYFAAGADFSDLKQISNEDDAAKFWLAIASALHAIATVGVPTIAMVNGHCLGGGCLLANACDLRFAAAEGALFGIPVAKLGILLDQENVQRLVNLVGQAQAKQMLFSGATMGSAHAAAIGLINEAVPDSELTQFTMNLAATIADNSSQTIASVKDSTTLPTGYEKPARANQKDVIESYTSADFRRRLAQIN